MTALPFLGRADEIARLRALIAGARNGVAGSLSIRGDPGVGKTTLLSHATDDVVGVHVVRVAGYEVESRLAYGALHRLSRSLDARVGDLPPRQRTALRVAMGVEAGPPPERLLVGLAALSLLAAAGEIAPVVCIVDDAHHLDPESLEVLSFVARRLSAEAVALIFASRDDEGLALTLAGVPTQLLGGLDNGAASQLLQGLLDSPAEPAVIADIVQQTGGNPLALTELARQGDLNRLAFAAIAGSPLPIGRRLEAHYSARVGELSADARQWLLTAAAESTGDAAVVRSATTAQGIPEAASAELEAEGLIEIHDDIRFRHAMVRSAVYNAATDVDRRRAHSALRVETALRGLDDFSGWHAAAAAAGADRALAQELVHLADRAAERGGLRSRAGLLARAAELIGDGKARGELLAWAAEAAIGAGAALLALDLLARVDVTAGVSEIVRGRLLLVQARCARFLSGPPAASGTVVLLLEAADAFRGHDPALEQRALLHAYSQAQSIEHSTGVPLEQLGRRLAAGVAVKDGPHALALRMASAFILEPYESAAVHLADTVDMLEKLDDAALLEFGYFAVSPTVGLWDADLAVRLLTRTARVAREAGALEVLDASLWVLSAVELLRGNPKASAERLRQSAEVRLAVGYGREQAVNAALMAWTEAPGEEVERTADGLLAGGWMSLWRMAIAALAIREIAEGHYQSAFERLVALLSRPFLQASFNQIPELVEAAVRSGHREDAEAHSSQMQRYAEITGRAWARGMAARCRALLAGEGGAEQHYVASIACLNETGMIGERGRAYLLYGEWLRRRRRRRDARAALHEAWRLLDQAGAVHFAARAERELRATGEPGETTSRPDGLLTSQEAAVARLAIAGETNAEIGASLFISANTVDYHLRKVFQKLGVNSRRQLAESAQRF